jgi:hyperosmotically inducible protein
MRQKFPHWVAALLAIGLVGAGCADRNQDAVPDQTQPNVPGSAANRAGEATRNAGETVDNATTTGRIKSALIADTTVGVAKIDVDTANDVVTLTGEVDTDAQKARAEEIAKQTEGVTKVVNNLTVKGQPTGSSTTP